MERGNQTQAGSNSACHQLAREDRPLQVALIVSREREREREKERARVRE